VHQLRYALYPHPGNHIDARVVNIAYEFNVPGRSIQTRPSTGAQKNQDSFIRCSSSNVIVDTIKQAEDGTDLIIRLYESSGIDCEVEITTATRYQQISEVNLMEINAQKLKVGKGGYSLRLKFRPFQIRTLRLERTS
jgi:alpha-mannosidase